MNDLTVQDMKVFVPAKNFQLSVQFYRALGWEMTWKDASLAILQLDDHRFCLQNYYQQDWAENFIIHLDVVNAQNWFERIQQELQHGGYQGARVNPPKVESYGATVTYAWDPSGVLLHFAQWDTVKG